MATVRQRVARRARYWARRARSRPHRTLRTWQFVAVAAALGGVVATGAVTMAGPWDSGQRTAERHTAARADASEAHSGDTDHGDRGHRGAAKPPVPGAAPAVLTPLGPVAGAMDRVGDGPPTPTAEGLSDALAPLLKDDALGSTRTAAVWDVATGKRLYGSRAGTEAVPASAIKLATGAAALAALGPDYRIPTRAVVAGRTVHLVGGGDPTLTKNRLRELAENAARALRADGLKRVFVRYDASRYGGPRLHPIGPNENIAPVVPLMINAGRLDDSDHGTAPRATDPATDAAVFFAERLAKAGVVPVGQPHAKPAPDSAEPIATVRSAPLKDLVERMLLHSDNDIAEALHRQTARASGEPASFAGGARAVAARLKALGLPVAGARFADGSGIDRDDRVSADLLARLLVKAASPEHPELRSILTGLPVAGFTGTLENRYATDSDTAGRGVVRAKTGTLTGVNSLAGTVVDADGRLLAFAFLSRGAPERQAAGKTLDRLASAVADCGCR